MFLCFLKRKRERRDNCLIVHMNKSATWLSAAVLNTRAELMKMVQRSPLKKVYEMFQTSGETPKHDCTKYLSSVTSLG